MMRFAMLSLVAMIMISMWPVEQADARRFGGGSSFGSHHRSFSPSHSQRPSHTASRPASSRAAASNNARPRSGFMGAIAGLAMGGLLGAMLFGGAFDGINMMDILLIAAIGFGLLWWFRRKAQQVAIQQGGYATSGAAMDPNNTHSYSDNYPDAAYTASATAMETAPEAKPEIDSGPFLDAARAIFVRMQTAWDQQDLDDIRRFCLPEVVSHIEEQMASQGQQRNITEVVTLEAVLLDSWVETGRDWAAVSFTAMMKEQTLDSKGSLVEESSERVQEAWTFCHDSNSDDPTWFVAGIAQQNS